MGQHMRWQAIRQLGHLGRPGARQRQLQGQEIAAVGVHLAFDAVAGPGLVKQGQRALRERVEPGTGTAIARLPLVAGERFRVMQRQAAMHA